MDSADNLRANVAPSSISRDSVSSGQAKQTLPRPLQQTCKLGFVLYPEMALSCELLPCSGDLLYRCGATRKFASTDQKTLAMAVLFDVDVCTCGTTRTVQNTSSALRARHRRPLLHWASQSES